MSKKIKIENVRLSYPNLFQKGFYEGKENKKYTATLVLDKSNPKHVAAKKLIDEQIETIFEDSNTKRVDFKEDKFCVKEESADFENSWLIKVGNSKRPTIIDRDKSPLAESDEKSVESVAIFAVFIATSPDNPSTANTRVSNASISSIMNPLKWVVIATSLSYSLLRLLFIII